MPTERTLLCAAGRAICGPQWRTQMPAVLGVGYETFLRMRKGKTKLTREQFELLRDRCEAVGFYELSTISASDFPLAAEAQRHRQKDRHQIPEQARLLVEAGEAAFGPNWKTPLAKATGLARQTVIRLAHGKHAMSRSTFDAIRDALEKRGVRALSEIPAPQSAPRGPRRCPHCGGAL